MHRSMTPGSADCSRSAVRSSPSSSSTTSCTASLDVARELTGARYAAVGVLDDAQTQLARFLTRGLDAETQRRDRRQAARSRRPGRADQQPGAAAARPRGRSPAVVRLPAEPPADVHVPRRPDPGPRSRMGQPLPDREGRGHVHGRRTSRRCSCSPTGPRSPSTTRASTAASATAATSWSAPSPRSRRRCRSRARSAPRRTSGGCSSSSPSAAARSSRRGSWSSR